MQNLLRIFLRSNPEGCSLACVAVQAAPQRRMQMKLNLKRSNRGRGYHIATHCQLLSTNMEKLSLRSILLFKGQNTPLKEL